MRSVRFMVPAVIAAGWLSGGPVGATDHGCTGAGCTGCGPAVPVCRGTWEEKKSSRPTYALRCEYACDRGRDPWHAPDPECRCQPPAGRLYVKKRLYSTAGKEKTERVPKYEVDAVPAGSPSCTGGCRHHDGPARWWDPLGLLAQPW